MQTEGQLRENLHSHTYRCGHATGNEREFVEEAIAKGLRVFGFSDHCPYPFPPEYHSPIRMDEKGFEDYVDTVLSLKREYAKDIEIHLGLEAEYYPAYFDAFLRLIEPYPVEYLLLGQHFVGDETKEGSVYAPQIKDDEKLLSDYVDQVMEAVQTGKFLYVAHPDLVNFTGPVEVYDREMNRLLAFAEETRTTLEFNLLGLHLGRSYPTKHFWEMVSQRDIQVVFGTDAHHTNLVADPDTIQRGYAMAAECGLTIIEENLISLPGGHLLKKA